MRTCRLSVLSATILLLAACGGGGDDANGGGGGGPTTIGGAGSRALYVLVGGTAMPTDPNLFRDSRLGRGEIFVMPQAALGISTTYTITVAASTASGEKFNHSWSFTTTAGAVTPGVGATVLSELNAYRSAAGNLPPVASNSAYTTAATKHAGYQAQVGAMGHDEPDNTKSLFVHNDFWARIHVANGGTPPPPDPATWLWSGANVVYEDIASTAGAAAVPQLWNTVYHRVPMMRRHVSIIGNGDRADAIGAYGGAVPAGVIGYQTIEFGGDSATAVMTSYWPHDGTGNVFTSFSTDSETPDPLSTSNPNGTPNVGTVGPPIHVLLPTTENFTSLTVRLTPP